MFRVNTLLIVVDRKILRRPSAFEIATCNEANAGAGEDGDRG